MGIVLSEFLNLMTWNRFIFSNFFFECSSIFDGPNYALENHIDTLSPPIT